MNSNQYKNKDGEDTVGAVRQGRGLLVGLLRCQRCGKKMHVRYWGKGGTNPRYVCPGDFNNGGKYCQSFAGLKTDSVFEEELFKALEPSAVQASIKACEALNQQHHDKLKYLDIELEKAQYEANRAFIQYNQADPLNRLVTTELEKRRNEKLIIANEVKERVEVEKGKIRKPTEEEIMRIKKLGERFPEVWRHPKTDPAIKKRIIRMMVQEVVMHLDEDTLILTMTIHWSGGIHTQVKFKKPTKGSGSKKTDDNVVDLLKKLSPHLPDEEIARVLNCYKLKTAQENSWTRGRVRALRAHYNIKPFDRKKKTGVVTMNEAAKQLDVPTSVIRTLIRNGTIKANQIIKYAPYEIESSELEKEEVQIYMERAINGQSSKSYRGVNSDHLRFI